MIYKKNNKLAYLQKEEKTKIVIIVYKEIE